MELQYPDDVTHLLGNLCLWSFQGYVARSWFYCDYRGNMLPSLFELLAVPFPQWSSDWVVSVVYGGLGSLSQVGT